MAGTRPGEAPSEHSKLSADVPYIRYPPFPSVPQGVSITPFKDFVPCGIVVMDADAGDGVEVDGLGIPTVPLLTEEHTVKKKKKKSKKKRNAGQQLDEKGRVVPWWEEWDETEEARVVTYAFRSTNYAGRVAQATDDFRVGRIWPTLASGVRAMWDHLRIFMGVIDSAPVYRRIKGGNKRARPESPDFSSDDGGNEEFKPIHRDSSYIQDPLEEVARNRNELKADEEESIGNIEALNAFANDIEKSVKIFLSSYMREKGLIWSERNLLIAPMLLHFFIRFMIRNCLFADAPSHHKNLLQALEVAELAKKELPVTYKFGQAMPDGFNEGCKDCWGRQGNWTVQVNHSDDDLRDSKRRKTSEPSDEDYSVTSARSASSKKSSDTNVWPAASSTPPIQGGWSDIVSGGWGNPADTTTGWNSTEHGWGDVSSWGIPGASATGQDTGASWTTPATQSLFAFLGPTNLPLTHTTGIIESSVRRIANIIPPTSSGPASNLTLSKSMHESVEEDLGARFTRIVLEPWVPSVEQANSDLFTPVIKAGSKGIVPAISKAVARDHSKDKIYNACRDNITLLVTSKVADLLMEGMGIGAIWVQIARRHDVEDLPKTEQGVKERLKESRHPSESFWYLEDVSCIFPSFYTE